MLPRSLILKRNRHIPINLRRKYSFMKTVLALSLALAGVAGASTISESCGGPVTLGGGSSPISGDQGPGSFTCGSIDTGAGNTITQIQLFYNADFNTGNTPGTNTVVWTFNTGSGTWSGGNSETVTGGFSSSGTSPVLTIGLLDNPFNFVPVGAGQIDTTDLGVGTESFAGLDVSAPVNITGGVITTTGALFAQITYSTPVSGTPGAGNSRLDG